MTEKISDPNLRSDQHLRVRMNAYAVPVVEGESAITSLTLGPDRRIYGATSGKNCHLFVFCNLLNKKIDLIEKIPGEMTVRNSLALDNDMTMYIGANSTDVTGVVHGTVYSLKISTETYFAEEGVNPTIFKVEKGLTSIGEPVKGEGIHNLLYHKQTNSIIGLTVPGTHLFKYDVTQGKFKIITRVSSGLSVVARRKGRLISNTLVNTADNNIYGTGDAGCFFKYDPDTDEIEYLEALVPGLIVRRDWNNAECFCEDEQGNIYGGTTDGFLFRLNLLDNKVTNFGKPSLERPINGLVYKNGVIYGVCGSKKGNAHVFSYDLGSSHFEDLGMINYVPCESKPFGTGNQTPWSAWKVAVMIVDDYGTIYLGEDDTKAHLFTLFI